VGFLKNLFGGKKEEPVQKYPTKPVVPGSAEVSGGSSDVDVGALSTKELIRLVGSGNKKSRTSAAAKLAETKERNALRPLMNSYLNHGDPEVLKALSAYGDMLTAPAIREAQDPGVVGERRLRMMDILGVTGSEEAVIAVRANVDPERNSPEIHTRACIALARLGDESGIDSLAHDLELTDPDQRTTALAALQEVDTPSAHRAVEDHVNRYLGDAGAVPERIVMSAPCLEDPDASLTPAVAGSICGQPHNLTLLVGSGAKKMARVRQSDIRRALKGCDVRFSTVRLAPEEQIAILEEAVKDVAADPTTHIVLVGTFPAPSDTPALPHFLVRQEGADLKAKVLFVDPHEYNLVLEWWHYVDDKAEIPTDFEVVLGVCRPETSAISREEYLIYELTPEDRTDDFLRAFLAHL
jgi:hypothetical protein